MSTGAIVARLAALDSASVSDALDRFGSAGALPALRPLSVPVRIAGRAITVRLGPPPGPTTDGQVRHLATAAVAASGPGRIIVIAHPGVDCAGWGGLLSLAAHLRGAEGTIVDGPCRDIDEAVELGYPIYGRAATSVTARGRLVEHGWDEPVEIGGIPVAPGDLVLADRGGAVFVPRSEAEDVITAAEDIAAREAAMASAIRDGIAVSDVMGASYEHLAGSD